MSPEKKLRRILIGAGELVAAIALTRALISFFQFPEAITPEIGIALSIVGGLAWLVLAKWALRNFDAK